MARNRKRAKERRARRPQPVPSSQVEREDLEEAPPPLEHAMPDVEFAETQMALGRPEMAVSSEEDEQEFEHEAAPDEEENAPLVSSGSVTHEHRGSGNRLINFLQGSWRELQRVQWPDRRQVMQATGVVIGFVIIAGVYLGIADWAAGKLMNYILTGHG